MIASEREAAPFLRVIGGYDAEAEQLRLKGDALTLKSGGGGGTSGCMEALIDAKVAAAEARTDAKFAAVLTKLDSLSGEVRSARGSIWTAALAIMGLIVAVVAIIATVAPSSFSAGAQMRDIARDEARASQVAAKPVPTVVPAAKAPAKP